VVSPVENLKFPLKDGEQRLDIAMLLGQALNDHGGAPTVEPDQIITNAVSVFAAGQNLGRNIVRRFHFSDLPK
jgi:hypothetical protein